MRATRLIGLAVAAAAGGSLLVGCGSTGAPETVVLTTTVSGTQTVATEARSLVVLGHPDHVGAALPLVEDLEPRMNVEPREPDAALFVVSARDGLMGSAADQFARGGRKRLGASAILLIHAEGADPERTALLLKEMREVLQQRRVRGAQSMPVLRDDDPNIVLLIQGLIAG